MNCFYQGRVEGYPDWRVTMTTCHGLQWVLIWLCVLLYCHQSGDILAFCSAFPQVKKPCFSYFLSCVWWWVICFWWFTILVGALDCVPIMASNSETSEVFCILATHNVTLEIVAKHIYITGNAAIGVVMLGWWFFKGDVVIEIYSWSRYMIATGSSLRVHCKWYYNTYIRLDTFTLAVVMENSLYKLFAGVPLAMSMMKITSFT